MKVNLTVLIAVLVGIKMESMNNMNSHGIRFQPFYILLMLFFFQCTSYGIVLEASQNDDKEQDSILGTICCHMGR